jgi:hypothetical protein
MVEETEAAVGETAATRVDEDGFVFDIGTLGVHPIREGVPRRI